MTHLASNGTGRNLPLSLSYVVSWIFHGNLTYLSVFLPRYSSPSNALTLLLPWFCFPVAMITHPNWINISIQCKNQTFYNSFCQNLKDIGSMANRNTNRVAILSPVMMESITFSIPKFQHPAWKACRPFCINWFYGYNCYTVSNYSYLRGGVL